jgi:linoleate 10R-lipoxygenase
MPLTLVPFQLSLAGIFGTIFGKKKNGHNELLKRLFELGHSNDQVVNEILALMIGVTVEVSLGRRKLAIQCGG